MGNHDNEKEADASGESEGVAKGKRPPQEVIEKMNRALVAAAAVGKTPSELEDDIYSKMFGVE